MSPIVPHHSYRDEPPLADWQLRAATATDSPDDARRRLRACGDALRGAGVGAVVLIHGTFVGDDPLGLLGELGRLAPHWETPLRRLCKRTIDLVMQENGNFSASFADRLAAGLAGDDDRSLRVVRFNWSGENHHLARCEAALALISVLNDLQLPPGRRILLWGHSHGGNVCALASWLLSAPPQQLDQLLAAAGIHYRSPLLRRIDRPLWERMTASLLADPRPLSRHPLDVVTFGMPLRYGWTKPGYDRLMHFVHHRPLPRLPPWRARFPSNPLGLVNAADGDYVQHFGIAGTNLISVWPPWRALLADWRLNRLLQGDLGVRRLWNHLRAGRRVADDGLTLLVDYGPSGLNFLAHMLGHGVYTRTRWMLWHLEQITQLWYAPQRAAAIDAAASPHGAP